MKQLISTMLFLGFSLVSLIGQPFQLASPKITTGEMLFTSESFLDAELALDGVTLMFTTDGSIPNQESKKYSGRINIDKDITIRVSAFHNSFLPSPPFDLRFIKIDPDRKIMKVIIEGEISKDYMGNLESTLFDNEKGSSNFSDGKWLGFKGQNIGLNVKLKKATNELSVLLSTMTNTGSWILGPGKVEVQILDPDTKKYKVVEEVIIHTLESETTIEAQFIKLNASLKNPINEFKLMIYQIDKIPAWHPGNHENTWIFVDEIIIK